MIRIVCRLLCSLSLCCLLTVAAQADHHESWVNMFNGKTLAGWTQKNGYATYEVIDTDGGKAIKGTTAEGSPNSFLCTVKKYGNFEFEFEVKVSDELN